MPLSIDFANLHTILATLYDDMLPLCKDMMDVGKGLAGLGALFYVAVRVWQSMARAEPIDVYPLLRPFAIGICTPAFPHAGTRHAEHRAQPDSTGYAQDA